MHDGGRKPSDHGQPFGLDDLIDVFLVEVAHAGAEFPDDAEGEAGLALQQFQQPASSDE